MARRRSYKVFVSLHAVEQCRKRVPWLSDASSEEIVDALSKTISRGKKVGRKPAKKGWAGEFVYQEIHTVGVIVRGTAHIVTCLGDTVYRNWATRQQTKRRFAC